MSTPGWRFVLRLVLSSVASVWAASRAVAHEPFDLSSRITIYDDRLELVSTLGSDGMRQLLSGTGLTEEEISDRLKDRGADAVVEYPATLAPQFFALKNNSQPLSAINVRSVSEGAEIILTVIYSRPAPGTLDVQAVCYKTVPALRNGVVSVYDESSGPLGTAMLSSNRIQMSVTVAALPPVTTLSPAAAAAVDASHSGSPADAAAAVPAPPLRPSFGEFFRLGVEHIWSGIDHLLFLAALLIGVRKSRSILGIITCFTLAHSVTLALAALNVVSIPSRVIEPLIAATIIVVCLANFARPTTESDRVWMAGVFGLIHGFGFAGALKATGLGGGGASMAVPLFTFNLGVEAGQLTVAAVFLPLLFLVRRWPRFVRYGVPTLSGGVLLVSGYWLVERTFF